MCSINCQSLSGCAIKQENPKIDKSYMGKNKIHLNDAKPKILYTQNWSPGR